MTERRRGSMAAALRAAAAVVEQPPAANLTARQVRTRRRLVERAVDALTELAAATGPDVEDVVREQRELFSPDHASVHARRLRWRGDRYSVNAERVYAAEWLRQNRTTGRRGRDAGLLEAILHPLYTSRRDAVVVACVIQWLGTNVGGSFLKTCEDKVERQRARQNVRLARRDVFRSRFALPTTAAADAEVQESAARRRGIALRPD